MSRWRWGYVVLALALLVGCQTKKAVPAAPAPVQIDFDAAAKRLAEAELWRMEETLAQQKRSGRALLNEETLFLTILELTPERSARQRAVNWRSRLELTATGAEFRRRSALDEAIQEELNAGNAEENESLQQAYLVNHRAQVAVTLRLRRMLQLAPDAELEAENLASWRSVGFPFAEELKLADFLRVPIAGRAELGKYAGNVPDLLAEMERIPFGGKFPLKRFAALPAALAEKRAASPEMDWQFAAAYGACIGIRQELTEAFGAWRKLAIAAGRVGENEEFHRKELELQRDLAGCRMVAALGNADGTAAPSVLRVPTPGEQLAAAWVTEYLLSVGEP